MWKAEPPLWFSHIQNTFGQNVLDPLGNPSSLEDDVFRATLITIYLCMIKLLIGKELYDVVKHAHGVLRYMYIST